MPFQIIYGSSKRLDGFDALSDDIRLIYPATPSRALSRPLTRVLPIESSFWRRGGVCGVGAPAMCPCPPHVYVYLTSLSAVRPS